MIKIKIMFQILCPQAMEYRITTLKITYTVLFDVIL